MKARLLVLLLLCFIGGFTIGLGIKFFYESKNFKPYYWDRPPIVANCYGKDFSEDQMLRAIEFWSSHGHEIGFYEHNPPSSVCEEGEIIHGFIILKKARLTELSSSTLATTRRATSGLVIRGAEIVFKPGSQNLSLINEHELGHAFGYTHVNIENHIMHPMFNKMGAEFWIP